MNGGGGKVMEAGGAGKKQGWFASWREGKRLRELARVRAESVQELAELMVYQHPEDALAHLRAAVASARERGDLELWVEEFDRRQLIDKAARMWPRPELAAPEWDLAKEAGWALVEELARAGCSEGDPGQALWLAIQASPCDDKLGEPSLGRLLVGALLGERPWEREPDDLSSMAAIRTLVRTGAAMPEASQEASWWSSQCPAELRMNAFELACRSDRLAAFEAMIEAIPEAKEAISAAEEAARSQWSSCRDGGASPSRHKLRRALQAVEAGKQRLGRELGELAQARSAQAPSLEGEGPRESASESVALGCVAVQEDPSSSEASRQAAVLARAEAKIEELEGRLAKSAEDMVRLEGFNRVAAIRVEALARAGGHGSRRAPKRGDSVEARRLAPILAARRESLTQAMGEAAKGPLEPKPSA